MIQQNEEYTLADYWHILYKRRNIALLTFALTVTSVYIFTKLMTPIYQSSVSVELRSQSSNLLSLGGLPTMFNIINRDTEIRKVESYPIISETAKALEMIDESSSEADINNAIAILRSQISVKEVMNTTLIKITAQNSDSDKAVLTANTAAKTYVKQTIDERNERTKKTREFIEDQLSIVGNELRSMEEKARKFKQTGKITDRISDFGSTLSSLSLQRSRLLTKYGEKHPEVVSLDKQMSNLKFRMGDLTSSELEYLYLMREISINEELYLLLSKKLKEALITEADKVIPVIIVDPARKAVLIKPNKKTNMVMGILAGFLLAIIGVLLSENIDTSLRTAHDIETYLNVPALTEIPHLKVKSEEQNYPHLLFQNQNSAYLEAYNNLEAAITSFKDTKQVKTILFSSMMPREGKSEVVSNFGIGQSQSKKILLIDTDFRQPSISKLFRIARKPGLIDVITQNLDWKHWVHSADSSDEIKTITQENKLFDLANLDIMPAGHLPPHPVRFLNSPEFANLLDTVKNSYDLVLLDSPPLYYFADPTIISNLVDAIIMVHKPGSVNIQELQRTIRTISEGNAKFLGVALNGVTGKVRGRYYYRYYSNKNDS